MSPRRTRGYRITRAERNAYRLEGAPMLLLAFGLVNSGVSALLDPDAAEATSVAIILHDVEWLARAWLICYTLAGLLLAYGLLKPVPVLEVLAETVAAWAMFFNVLALLLLRGPAGSGASIGAYFIAIFACGARIHMLHQRAATDRRHIQRPYLGPDRRAA